MPNSWWDTTWGLIFFLILNVVLQTGKVCSTLWSCNVVYCWHVIVYGLQDVEAWVCSLDLWAGGTLFFNMKCVSNNNIINIVHCTLCLKERKVISLFVHLSYCGVTVVLTSSSEFLKGGCDWRVGSVEHDDPQWKVSMSLCLCLRWAWSRHKFRIEPVWSGLQCYYWVLKWAHIMPRWVQNCSKDTC